MCVWGGRLITDHEEFFFLEKSGEPADLQRFLFAGRKNLSILGYIACVDGILSSYLTIVHHS